jgi:hypothetical protein
MDLDEEYPKTCRQRTDQISALLKDVPGLKAEDR